MNREVWKWVPETIYFISNFGRVNNGKKIYNGTKRSDGYYIITFRVNGKKKNMLIHRLVFSLFHNIDISEKIIDHIDHNPSNNRLDNLRICSKRENMMNSTTKKTSSKYKGVSFDKERGRWFVQLKNGKTVFRGRADTEKEAAKIYDNVAIQQFGDFARTNRMIYPADFIPEEIK